MKEKQETIRENSARIARRRAKREIILQKAEGIHREIDDLDAEIRRIKLNEDASESKLKRLERRKKFLGKKQAYLHERAQALISTRFITFTRRKTMYGLIFVSPWLIGFLLLFAYPFIQTVRLSVGEITDLKSYTITYSGFQEYSRILLKETDILGMLFNVLKDAFVNMGLITVFAFYIAMLLNRKMRFRGLFRVVSFLPVMLGSGFIMQQLLAQDITKSSMQAVVDLILPNDIIMYIGPKITNAVVFFLNKLTVILWHSGVQILLFLSGLQSISGSLYEAARVDGATEWENLWFITIPMMTPMILLNLVFTIVETFYSSDNKIISYMQKFAFEYNSFSYASAMGIIFLVFALLLIGLVFLIMRPFTKKVKS